jgi:hypothetical protein
MLFKIIKKLFSSIKNNETIKVEKKEIKINIPVIKKFKK